MTVAISLYVGIRISTILRERDIFMPAPVFTVLDNNYEGMKALEYAAEFNKRLDGKLFSFNFGLRPIVVNIVDSSQEVDDYVRLGSSYVNPLYCYIELSDSLKDYEIRIVLLHELLHCYNVSHVDKEIEDQGDLMDPLLRSRPPTEQNIDYYLRVLYEKRGLRP